MTAGQAARAPRVESGQVRAARAGKWPPRGPLQPNRPPVSRIGRCADLFWTLARETPDSTSALFGGYIRSEERKNFSLSVR